MKCLINKRIFWLIGCICFCFLIPAKATSKGEVDVQDIVFSHIQDAYSWHITEWNGHHVEIPLPILVRSQEQGWNFFLSNRLSHGHTYQNYYIATEGDYVGKVVERNSQGEEVRPLDLSLTKNVIGLFIACGLLVFIVLRTANWYAKHPNQVPKGFVGVIETVVTYIHESVIKASIGDKHYHSYSSYLLTVFFFILINNLLGIVPIFPGGANTTGNITVSLALAACTFIAINLFAPKSYWKEIFWPSTPIYLKLPIPIMPFVEFIGIFTKPIALMIRLFANIMAGHSIILALTCLVFITASMGVIINTGMTVVSVFFCVFMNCMELLVACLQAYIFTMLSASFIGQSKTHH